MTEITNQHSAKANVQVPENVAKNSFGLSEKPKVDVAGRANLGELRDYVVICLRDYCDGFSSGFNYLPQDARLDDFLLEDEDALIGDWAAVGEDMKNAILEMVEEDLKGSWF